MKLQCSVFILLTIFAFPSIAQSNDQKLIVKVPAYWAGAQLIHQQELGRGIAVIGQIPTGQSKNNYEESIWENRFPGMPRPMPIAQFANEMLTSYWKQCETLRTTKPLEKKERGYDTLYVQATCNRVKAEPHKAIVVRAKYICAKNSCYSISHEFALNSYDAVRGGEVSVVPDKAFGDKEKASRFQRFLETSTKSLEEDVYLCASSEESCS